MSDLLLTHGYFLFEDEKEMQIMRPYPTLGLLYISAFLRREGFDVEIFDTTFAQRQQLFDRLAQGSGVIGIYTNLMTRKPVLGHRRRGETSWLDRNPGRPRIGQLPRGILWRPGPMSSFSAKANRPWRNCCPRWPREAHTICMA